MWSTRQCLYRVAGAWRWPSDHLPFTPDVLAQALHAACQPERGVRDVGTEESGRQVTTWMKTLRTIDELQATIDRRTELAAKLTIENASLRRKVDQLTGELAEARAQPSWQAKR